jgi:hypothetical protein
MKQKGKENCYTAGWRCTLLISEADVFEVSLRERARRQTRNSFSHEAVLDKVDESLSCFRGNAFPCKKTISSLCRPDHMMARRDGNIEQNAPFYEILNVFL